MGKKNVMTIVLLAAAVLTGCQGSAGRKEQVEQYRRTNRQQYYEQRLRQAQRQLAHTDSLLQLAEADTDTLNVQKRLRLDSLRHAFDVQGAQVRYIHRKQKELQ